MKNRPILYLLMFEWKLDRPIVSEIYSNSFLDSSLLCLVNLLLNELIEGLTFRKLLCKDQTRLCLILDQSHMPWIIFNQQYRGMFKKTHNLLFTENKMSAWKRIELTKEHARFWWILYYRFFLYYLTPTRSLFLDA